MPFRIGCIHNARVGTGQTALQYIVRQILMDDNTKDDTERLNHMLDALDEYGVALTKGEEDG